MKRNDEHKLRVIGTYRHPVVRAYCTVRFLIMNMRILEEIGQYLPSRGRILDVGCGFGLFSLFYALAAPGRRLHSCDIDRGRIDQARSSAAQLGIGDRVEFDVQDAVAVQPEPGAYDAAYLMDILHHLPVDSRYNVVTVLHRALTPGGILIIKEIDTFPRWRVLFTWVLDILMSPRHPPHYIDREELIGRLEAEGFDVKVHALMDVLPYPHVLYVCRKAGAPA